MDSSSSLHLSIPQRFLRIIIVAALILLMPLVGMWLELGVNWSTFDFIIMGALLVGAGIAYEVIVATVARRHRVLTLVLIIAAAAVIWGELAVGIFSSLFAGN